MNDGADTTANAPTRPRIEHVARMLLATREFGLIASRSVEAAVGPDYTENSVVATLAALERLGALRPKDLDHLLGLSSPNVSRIVDRLEASGDVVRRTGAIDADQRAVELRLTRAGRRRTRAISEAIFTDTAEITLVAKQAVSHIDQVDTSAPLPISADEIEQTKIGEGLARVGLELQSVLREVADDVAGSLALFALALEGGHGRPTMIAERVGLTSGGTTKVIDRLETVGLVERSFGTNSDRRAVELHLTTRGEREIERMADESERHLPELRRLFHLVITLLEQRTR